MLRYPRLIFLAAALFACGPRPLPPERSLWPPIEHDVKREFALAADLDAAHAAVIAVYARLMLPVDQLETKDGPQFRLINAQTIDLKGQGDYADCGVLRTERYKKVLKWKWDKLGLSWVDKLVSITERPAQARTMAFNLVLLAQGANNVVMRIETSFKDAAQRPCTSKGTFEELIYTWTLNELRPRNEEPANPNTTRPAPR